MIHLGTMKSTLGTRMKTSRLDAGYTQEALGEALGVSSEAISQYERGQSKPTYERLQAVSRLLGVDPCWLAFGIGQADNTILDVAILETILETVVVALRSRKRPVDAKKQAKLITRIYQHVIQKSDKSVNEHDIAFLVDMINE